MKRIIGLLLLCFLLTSCGTYKATVIGLPWVRSIPYETFMQIFQEGWSYPPSDAYNVRYETRQRGFKSVSCGTETTTRYVNGKSQTSTRTKYCNVPDYDTWYMFNVNRWIATDHFITSGQSGVPLTWSAKAEDVTVSNCAIEVIGCTRLGARLETFRVIAAYEDRTVVQLNVTQDVYEQMHLGDRLSLDTDLFGSVQSIAKD